MSFEVSKAHAIPGLSLSLSYCFCTAPAGRLATMLPSMTVIDSNLLKL